MESDPSRAIRVWSSPFRARSRTKTGAYSQSAYRGRRVDASGGLTKAPFVLKRPMQPHDARVPRTQTNQRVLLRKRGLLLLVALQMCLVYPFYRVLLARREEGAQPHLRARQRQVRASGGGEGGWRTGAYCGVRALAELLAEVEVIDSHATADGAVARLALRARRGWPEHA